MPACSLGSGISRVLEPGEGMHGKACVLGQAAGASYSACIDHQIGEGATARLTRQGFGRASPSAAGSRVLTTWWFGLTEAVTCTELKKRESPRGREKENGKDRYACVTPAYRCKERRRSTSVPAVEGWLDRLVVAEVRGLAPPSSAPVSPCRLSLGHREREGEKFSRL